MLFNAMKSTMGFRLLIMTLLAGTAAAADDAEFAFNLFSDIAPVIALFGDQFARQFMSESLTWVDHVVFAMVPLGILTAITAAIRVQGSPVAKAFIGRARENKALAEIELMSSTSGEVCELFNGNSIVRAMGKPRITEFLIFPKKYKESERKYADNLGGTEPAEDESWGIESFRSANSERCKEMKCKPYESKSTAWIREQSTTVRKALEILNNSWKEFPKSISQILYVMGGLFIVIWKLRHSWNSKEPRQTSSDMESGHMTVSALPDQTTPDSNINTVEDEKATGEADTSRPPEGSSNLQLNLSSDYSDHSGPTKGQEIALAAIFGVILQLGLIVIAAIITFYLSPSSHSLLETKAYGFPCYVVGTVMLSIERVDGSPKDKRFSLLWVQQHQTVNDQTFKGYVILAGQKRRIMTSRRKTYDIQQYKAGEKLWRLATLGAAVSAGIGFVAQFMGLRGLAFPCSIAQLGAIILMALIRAWIRRRLGRLPVNSIALAGYELDFLATHITFNPDFLNFQWSKGKDEKPFGKERRPTEFCRWYINTPEDVSLDRSKDSSNVLSPEGIQKDSIGKLGTAASGHHEPKLSVHERPHLPSSQQLLRVRERLSNLCKWNSKASESARALAQSIEHFMDTFSHNMRDGNKGQLRALNWEIKSTRRPEEGDHLQEDYIQISVKRSSQGKWKADLGKIDAALSLWMADIEAKRLNKERTDKDNETDSSQDWRRTQSGNDLTYKYGRLVGDNLKDDVLKRDISWWVDGIIADQCDPRVREIRKDGQDTSQQKSQHWRKDGDLVIGTKEESENVDASEFGISSTGSLPCILAQHLFTSFIWTAVKRLSKGVLQTHVDGIRQVEIEGVHVFDSQSFDQMWFRPRLRHRQLSKSIRQMETYGLGSMNEILLCIIPAFSHMGLLPNQEILKLMPRIRSGHGWVEVAMCHTRLLQRVKEPSGKSIEKLTAAAIISAMDFVLLAYEPYDENTKPSEELNSELGEIIATVVSAGLRTVMEKIIPFYHLQNRGEAVARIFRQFSKLQGVTKALSTLKVQEECLDTYISEDGDDEFLDESFAIETLDFSKQHFDLVSPLKRDKSPRVTMLEIRGKAKENSARLKMLDVFGWSALHYGSVAPKRCPSYYLYAESAGALYEMTLLSEKLGDTMRDLELVLKKDLWHRQALHLACKFGHDQVIVELLKMGARSDQFDDFEKSPVDYFLEAKRIKRSPKPDEEQNIEAPTPIDHGNAEGLGQEDRAIFLKFSPKPDTEYQHRKTLLHIAVEIEDGGTIAALCDKNFNVNARDQSGRTPLHYALAASNVTMAKSLVEAFGAVPTIKDSQGVTSLLLSASRGLMGMVRFLVRRNYDPSEADSDGKTALDMAIARGHEKIAIYLLKLEQKQDGPFMGEGNSSLVTACREGLSRVVPRILDKWPELIDKPGTWDEPPISWACENGHSAIVKQLIAHLEDKPDIKPQVLNQQATRWRNYTPLHFATCSPYPKCLALLLDQDCVKLDLEDAYGNTPVHLTIQEDKIDHMRQILMHRRTSFGERIKYVKELINLPSSNAYSSSISEILESVTDATLLDEFLVWFLDKIEEINKESLLRLLVTNVKEKSWGRFSSPWELVALFNHLGFKKELKSHNADENGFDEDGWSCVEFVKSFNRTGTFKHLLCYLESQREASSIPPLTTPVTLVGEQFLQAVYISTCPTEGHANCGKVHRVNVVKEIDDVGKVCLRSDHCISAESDYFYYEVKVLAEAPCQWLGVGFCGWDTGEDEMPGWFERSWAYHGDDGLLFVDSVDGDRPSQDFGEQGVFGSKDTVGVCLNMNTGQGFCTKNGKRLDMGDVFSLPDERFNYGKLYPCVGFDVTSEGVGLDFEVNFDGSGQHPFEYKGPYI
ncbi:uncharacterized protein FTJAE_14208 [Fusarium tjaetaba]|uniref:B30.2/SPRY domain-containing protein n=1 Tax=Fusarium tjaetaba TaxID=1567544 RepID=A0A8H5QB12_9HYPO|nr:uncharacterized protein FTJAE_14208 [Fusarium tjaetaba]KAF5611338.1 hypothetical protein FTJAE_14208 [Fusarium tjaetaba]